MIPYAACRLLRGPCPSPPPTFSAADVAAIILSVAFWLVVFWLSGLGRAPAGQEEDAP